MPVPADGRSEPLDAERIFVALGEHDVDYVLIGGLAVQTHGHTRMTNDVDVIPAPERANLERLASALRAIGGRVLNAGSEDLEISGSMPPRTTIWQIATRHGDIDVLHEAPGAGAYEELRERALVIELGALRVQVAGRDDLIRMKLARGRPRDLADVAALTDPAVE